MIISENSAIITTLDRVNKKVGMLNAEIQSVKVYEP